MGLIQIIESERAFRRILREAKENRIIQEKEDAEAKKKLLQNNEFIYGITCVDIRQFYDSTWNVITAAGAVSITRREDERLAQLCPHLMNVTSAADIRALDEHDNIYYD